MTNNNYLTTEAYKKMSNEVTNVIEDLRLMLNTIEFIREPKDVANNSNMTVEYIKVYKYTDTLFNKLQGMIQTLEHVNGKLDSVDDLNELTGIVDEIYIIKERI